MSQPKKLKNVTLSAREDLIEQARERARAEDRTLNDAFREWLEQFTRPLENNSDFHSLMEKLQHVRPGKRFSREELNER